MMTSSIERPLYLPNGTLLIGHDPISSLSDGSLSHRRSRSPFASIQAARGKQP